MKITFVLPTSPRNPGGGYKVIYEYSNFLVEQGHDVAIACMANVLWARFHLPEPLRRVLARISIAVRPRWFELDKRIKKYPLFSVNNDTVEDSDVIIATAIQTADPVAKLNHKKGEKYYFIQDFENWSYTDDEVFDTYRLGMNNLTVAHWLSDLVDQYSMAPSVCIPNSINTEIFYVKRPIKERKRHSISFHFRSRPIKGAEYAFETIRILEEIYEDLSVTVVGLEVQPKGMPKSCQYVCRATPAEVAEIDNNVAVFMCSSILEGFGLPGLEAMACGCALVSTDYPAIHEYAEDGVTALISPVKDARKMAENIELLFENDDLRIQIAEKGAEYASQRSVQNSAALFEKTLLERTDN